jgi:hypothetical protein
MVRFYGIKLLLSVLVLCTVTILSGPLHAGNEVLGELRLKGATKVEKTSGVWIDGQYLGYLKELNGTKKILLLPGEHEVMVRQAGYKDFVQKIVVQPGEEQSLPVAMAKDLQVEYPNRKDTAEIKLNVEPIRAAVFVDGLFLGHVAEFDGVGKALLVAPGKRKITLSLPGYQTFETVIDLAPHQKFKLVTNLIDHRADGGTEIPTVPTRP